VLANTLLSLATHNGNNNFRRNKQGWKRLKIWNKWSKAKEPQRVDMLCTFLYNLLIEEYVQAKEWILTYTKMTKVSFYLPWLKVKHIVAIKQLYIKVHITSLTSPLLLKCLCQARKLSGHIFVYNGYQFCLLLWFFYWLEPTIYRTRGTYANQFTTYLVTLTMFDIKHQCDVYIIKIIIIRNGAPYYVNVLRD
jgi:hypothetical protein